MATFNYIKGVWRNGPGVVSDASETAIAGIERALSTPIGADEGELVRVHFDAECALGMAILRSPRAPSRDSGLRGARHGSFFHVIASDHPGARGLSQETARQLFESLYGTPLFEAVTLREREFLLLELPDDRALVTVGFATQDLLEEAFDGAAQEFAGPMGVSDDARGRTGRGESGAGSDPPDPVYRTASSFMRFQSQLALAERGAASLVGSTRSGAHRKEQVSQASARTSRAPAQTEFGEVKARQADRGAEGETSGPGTDGDEPELLPLSFLLRYRRPVPPPGPDLVSVFGSDRSSVHLRGRAAPESEVAPEVELHTQSGETGTVPVQSEAPGVEPSGEPPKRRRSLVAFPVAALIAILFSAGLGAGVLIGPDLMAQLTGVRFDTILDHLQSYTNRSILRGKQLEALEADSSRGRVDVGSSPEVAEVSSPPTATETWAVEEVEEAGPGQEAPSHATEIAVLGDLKPSPPAVGPSEPEVRGAMEADGALAEGAARNFEAVEKRATFAMHLPSRTAGAENEGKGEGGAEIGAAVEGEVKEGAEDRVGHGVRLKESDLNLETPPSDRGDMEREDSGLARTAVPSPNREVSSTARLPLASSVSPAVSTAPLPELAEESAVEAGSALARADRPSPALGIPEAAPPAGESDAVAPIDALEPGDEGAADADDLALPPVSALATADEASEAQESNEPSEEALRRQRKRDQLLGRMQRYR